MDSRISIRDEVYNFKTKHKEGFTSDELEELISRYPDINMDKYNDAMMGNTYMIKDGESVTYHCDVLTAIRCGVENRDQKLSEWD